MTITVFDLDGVLADVRHRLHYLEQRPKDWRSFFREAVHDPLLAEGRRAVSRAMADGHDLVYLTGRPAWCRRDTTRWLAQHGLPAAPLRMRTNRDRRPARFFKADELTDLARQATIAAMYDDDRAVVDHLRELGFPMVHVTWMTAPTRDLDALFDAQEEQGRT